MAENTCGNNAIMHVGSGNKKPPEGYKEVSAMHLGKGIWAIRWEKIEQPEEQSMSEGKLMNYNCPLCGKQLVILTDSIGYSYQCDNPECVICETMDYFRPDTIDALSRKIAGLELDRSKLSAKEKEIEGMRKQIASIKHDNHRMLGEALNSGDGVYRP